MNFGSIYSISWWGDTNAPNGWGIVYPYDADGSTFTVDTTLITVDSTQFTADQTTY